MFGGGDGNLSDTSDAPSNISNISEALNGRGHLVSQNLNLSVTSNSSVGEDPKTQEIRRLREENSRLKRRLQDILGDSEEDEEDARKDWSELSKKRKKQLLSNISTQMGKLAEKKGDRDCEYCSKSDCQVPNENLILKICHILHLNLLQALLDT